MQKRKCKAGRACFLGSISCALGTAWDSVASLPYLRCPLLPPTLSLALSSPPSLLGPLHNHHPTAGTMKNCLVTPQQTVSKGRPNTPPKPHQPTAGTIKNCIVTAQKTVSKGRPNTPPKPHHPTAGTMKDCIVRAQKTVSKGHPNTPPKPHHPKAGTMRLYCVPKRKCAKDHVMWSRTLKCNVV